MPEIVLKYFPVLTDTQRQQFAMLQQLYGEWNERINVISRKDIGMLYERHVLHSLGIAKVISFKKDTRILDVGTGGGFPGLPLAIMFPDSHFTLIDSIGKKIGVVKQIAAAGGLRNVSAFHTRAEDVKEKFHFVVSRAVTEFPVFYRWVRGRFLQESFNALPNGILYLKGGDLREEFGKLYDRCTFFDLRDFFTEEFFETKRVVYCPSR